MLIIPCGPEGFPQVAIEAGSHREPITQYGPAGTVAQTTILAKLVSSCEGNIL